MRSIETFPSKQVYPYLLLVVRKVSDFYHNIDRRCWLVWSKWLIFITFLGQFMVSLVHLFVDDELNWIWIHPFRSVCSFFSWVWWWLLVEDESWRRGRWVRISVNFHQLDTVKGDRGVQMIFIVFSTNFFSTYRLIEFSHRHLGY